MNKKIPLTIIIAQALAGAAYGAPIDSNGTGGGNWSSTGTWAGGIIPTNANYQIQGTDAVTASAITISDASNDPNILGTLDLTNSSSLSVPRINNGTTTPGGVMIINDSAVSAAQIRPGAGGTFTATISNGGSLALSQGVEGSPSVVIINVNSGGTYITTSSFGETINLNGGTIYSNTNGDIIDPTTWSGGTLITNTQVLSSTYAGSYSTLMSSNSANTFVLSNNSSPQTVTWNNTSVFHPTTGTVVMNVYSTSTSDLMTYESAGGGFSLGTGVDLSIQSSGVLPAGDYMGATYTLFNNPNFNNVNPTILPATWDIAGTEYTVTFTDDLKTNGTVVVSSLTAVPEPAALGLFSIASLIFLRRRSPRQRPGC